jgi:hypothetical protein
MNRLRRQFGWLPAALLLVGVGQLPVPAFADPLFSGITLVSNQPTPTRPADPLPLDAAQLDFAAEPGYPAAYGPAWPGDPEPGLQFTLHPEDQQYFLGWYLQF